MSDTRSLQLILSQIFGPLVKVTSKLPAPLAYVGVIIIVLALIILLHRAEPSPAFMWLVGILALAGLAAFIYCDRAARQNHRPPSTLGQRRHTIRGNIYFDDGSPIKDAQVFVEGTRFDTDTNSLGWFEIEVDEQKSWTIKAIFKGRAVEKTVAKDEIQMPVRLIISQAPGTKASAQMKDDLSFENDPGLERYDIAKRQILEYLERNRFRMVSFERIRKNIDPEYDDDFLRDMIRCNETQLRRATLKGGKPGVARKG